MEASGPKPANSLKNGGFCQELAALKVDGEPLYKPVTRLSVRPATEEGGLYTTRSARPRKMRTRFCSCILSTWIRSKKKPPLGLAQRRLSTHYSRGIFVKECRDWRDCSQGPVKEAFFYEEPPSISASAFSQNSRALPAGLFSSSQSS